MERINFLASLANAPAGDSDAEKAAAAVAPEQWPALFAEAGRHHLLPLIWNNIKRWRIDASLPVEVRGDVERRCVESALYTEYLVKTGNALMRGARERGLTLVPLKGMHLVPGYYRADERPMIDIDFLVREDEIEAVRTFMDGAGFALQPGRLAPEFLRRFGGEFKFDGGGEKLPAAVETQWDIASAPHLRRGYAFDPLWLLSSVGGDGRLSAEATLVYLVFHVGVSHSFSRLLWLMDIHRVISGGGIRWDEVGEAVGRFGMGRLFTCAVALCEGFFGTRAPAGVVSRMGGGKWGLEAARRCLEGEGWVFRAGVLPLLLGRNRFRAVGAYLFPGAEFVSLRYGMPRWKAAAYQFARPAALAAEAVKRRKDRARPDF